MNRTKSIIKPKPIEDDDDEEENFYRNYQKRSNQQMSLNAINRTNRMPTRYSQNYTNCTQEIELHGKSADEAQELVIGALDSARNNHIKKIFFITGRGVHSAGNIPILKPLVFKICKTKGFSPTLSKNRGTIICDII